MNFAPARAKIDAAERDRTREAFAYCVGGEQRQEPAAAGGGGR
jgi:hypothetical protein